MKNGTVQDWNYDNSIPSEPDYCAKIIHLILDELEKHGWSNKDVFGIHMAMEEAIMNAIRHGNHCAPDKDVQVEISILSDRFYAKITDQGCGFDPTAIPDPTDDENVEKSSGRGVMLIKNFVDEIVYNDLGNSLELTKLKSK
ncbi:MAG: serine/threonine-protein kinase RsbW [Mariniblastus sp.]|jgi:serine/threonine-protein kinase RsbW